MYGVNKYLFVGVFVNFQILFRKGVFQSKLNDSRCSQAGCKLRCAHYTPLFEVISAYADFSRLEVFFRKISFFFSGMKLPPFLSAISSCFLIYHPSFDFPMHLNKKNNAGKKYLFMLSRCRVLAFGVSGVCFQGIGCLLARYRVLAFKVSGICFQYD